MIDFIVVGAGIGGSSIVRAAQQAGYSTLLIDPDPTQNASHAAIGLLHIGNGHLFHNKIHKDNLRKSVGLYRQWRALLGEQATAINATEPTITKVVPRYYQVDLHRALLPPDMHRRVVQVNQHGVVLDSGVALAAQIGVVVAAGPFSPRLLPSPLNQPFMRASWGATLLLRSDTPPSDTRPLVYRFSAYQCINRVVDPDGTLRIGSSTLHPTPQGHLKRAPEVELLRMLRKAPPSFTAGADQVLEHLINEVPEPGAEVRVGVRVDDGHLTQGYTPLYQGSLCRFAGFGKMGYSLAPALAETVIAHMTQATGAYAAPEMAGLARDGRR